jgi:hypothetical protein
MGMYKAVLFILALTAFVTTCYGFLNYSAFAGAGWTIVTFLLVIKFLQEVERIDRDGY